MNAMRHVQNKFAWEPLRSYVDECQKNETYFVFTLLFHHFLFIICEISVKEMRVFGDKGYFSI